MQKKMTRVLHPVSQEGLTLCARKALRCIWPRQEAAMRVAALSRRCWRAVRRPTWPRHAAAMRVAALRASRSILLACKPLPAQAHDSDKGHRSTEHPAALLCYQERPLDRRHILGGAMVRLEPIPTCTVTSHASASLCIATRQCKCTATFRRRGLLGLKAHLKAAWMMRAEAVSRLPRAPSSCASWPARRNTRVLPICRVHTPA